MFRLAGYRVLSGRCLAITGTCMWSNNDRATSRHRRGRAKWSVTRRRCDHKAANVSAGKTGSSVIRLVRSAESNIPAFRASEGGGHGTAQWNARRRRRRWHGLRRERHHREARRRIRHRQRVRTEWTRPDSQIVGRDRTQRTRLGYRRPSRCAGPDLLQQLSAKTGLPLRELTEKLSQVLPQAVDHLTPDGKIPTQA